MFFDYLELDCGSEGSILRLQREYSTASDYVAVRVPSGGECMFLEGRRHLLEQSVVVGRVLFPVFFFSFFFQ